MHMHTHEDTLVDPPADALLGAAMAQEVKRVVWHPEGCRFNPRLHLQLSVETSLRHLTPNVPDKLAVALHG